MNNTEWKNTPKEILYLYDERTNRALRGGSWKNHTNRYHSDYFDLFQRYFSMGNEATYAYYNIGFRIVRTV